MSAFSFFKKKLVTSQASCTSPFKCGDGYKDNKGGEENNFQAKMGLFKAWCN